MRVAMLAVLPLLVLVGCAAGEVSGVGSGTGSATSASSGGGGSSTTSSGSGGAASASGTTSSGSAGATGASTGSASGTSTSGTSSSGSVGDGGVECDVQAAGCACTFVAGTASAGGSCNAALYPSGLCCAGSDWPAADAACQCATYGCEGTSTDCTCAWGQSAVLSTCMATLCCAATGGDASTRPGCACGDVAGSCSEFGTPYTAVTACSSAAPVCPTGQKKVTSCN